MSYSAVSIYDLDGNFLGYSIKQTGVDKLLNNNLWSERPEDVEDLKAQLARLNDAVDIRAYWPDVRDPEVQELVNNPDWEPLVLSPVEVMDEENSIQIWEQEPNLETGEPGILDRDASIIVFKNVMAPAPAHVQARIKKACEIVARRRANA
jgi:hypothetical protein